MSLCEKCQSKGLPIYPVRYAVAPSYITASLPSWADKKELPVLSQQSKYVLRTMRKGYLYVFNQCSNGILDVTVYAVDEDGGFWQQDITKERELLQLGCNVFGQEQKVPLSEGKTSCNNSAHSASNIAFITIPEPDKCDAVWLAFSEHRWSFSTLESYLHDENKRKMRMQLIKPKEWIAQQNNKDGVAIANAGAIASTMEMLFLDNSVHTLSNSHFDALLHTTDYHFNYPYLYATVPTKEEPISESKLFEKPFQYNKLLFTKRNTLTPWPKLSLDNLQTNMIKKSKYSDDLYKKITASHRNSASCPAMMVALVDSIGIVAELNSWGNNAINSAKKVIAERQRENAAFSGIQLLEETIKNNDYASNQTKFERYIEQKNKAYLKNAHDYNQGDFINRNLLKIAEREGITAWDDEQKAKGLRVLNIMENAQNQYIAKENVFIGYRSSPDERDEITGLHRAAASLLARINDNYPIETVGEPAYSDVFMRIFEHENFLNKATTSKLYAELEQLERDFTTKFSQYKTQWHKNNKTQESGEQLWQKNYQKCLNSDYSGYKKAYAAFLTDSDNYLTGLLDDLIVWIDCVGKKERHLFSLAADDLERDSDNYLAFANDILMTLGMQAEDEKISQYFNKLIEDSQLDSHNLVWSSVLAGRKLDKAAQRKCVSFLLDLNKNQLPSDMTFAQLLDKLQTVLDFYSGDSFENNTVIDLAASISGLNDSVFNPNESHHERDSAKEVISLLNSERSAIFDENSPQSQISEAYLKPIKEASVAALIPLLKYLQSVGGQISSEFAQAWFVASMPGRLSKTALNKLMASYQEFADRLKQNMLKNANNMANKFAVGSQALADINKKVLSGKAVGGSLVGGILAYHLFTIHSILSDNSLKIKTQQDKQDIQLLVAGSASISLSFRLVAVYGENGRIAESALTNVKFLGNFFGFISGLAKLVLIKDEWENGKRESFSNIALFYIGAITETVSTIDLFLQLQKTSLVEVIEKRFKLATSILVSTITKSAVKVVFQRAIMAIVLIALNPWFNLGLFLIQLAIELNKEDDMQIWLKRCRFGESQFHFHKDNDQRYTSSEQEVKELKAIFEKFQQQLAEYYQEQQERINEELSKQAQSMLPLNWSQQLSNMRFN